MKNNINTIINAIRSYAEIGSDKLYNTVIAMHEGVYEVSFRTDYLHYNCFVDASTLEVIGFDCEPIPSTYPAQAA